MKTNPNHPSHPDPARSSESTFNNQDPLSLHTGLTKREYFAGLAMQGILANSTGVYTENNQLARSPSQMSVLSVQHADALIEALNK